MKKSKEGLKALIACALTTTIITSVTSNTVIAKEVKENVKVESPVEKDKHGNNINDNENDSVSKENTEKIDDTKNSSESKENIENSDTTKNNSTSEEKIEKIDENKDSSALKKNTENVHNDKDKINNESETNNKEEKSNSLKCNIDTKNHNHSEDSTSIQSAKGTEAPTILKAILDLRIKWKNDLTGGENINLKNPAVKSKVSGYEKQTKAALEQLNKDESKGYIWEDCKDFKTKSAHITNMYKKVYSMAMAYNIKDGKYYHDSGLKQDILYCLDWIWANAYNKCVVRYDNWWDWQIGSPSQLVNISVLMYDDLSDEQKVNYMESIQQFLQLIDPGSKYHTGANLADVCLIRLLQGAILNDPLKMQDASDKIVSVFDKVTEHDGFYVDGSFVQHGKVAYTGSYGNVLLEKLSNMLFLTEGTQWEIKTDAKNNIYSWVFDSFDPIIYKGYVMDMVRGRSISRYNGSGYDQASGIIESIVRLSTVADTNTAKELKSLVKQWQTEATHMEYGKKLKSINMIQEFYTLMNDSNVQPKKQEDEHHAFNCMDKTVHERQDYALGISRSSKRISKYEYMNNENLKPWFQGDGMTYLFNNDLTQFSEDFWPTINPMRLPGTTIDTRERPNATGTTDDDFYKMSHASWSGGTTLGKYGVSGMEIINKVEDPSTQTGIYNNYDNLQAKKSWFMFDDEIVALGSGITSPDKYNVETIIENRKIKKDGTNEFIVDGQSKVQGLNSKDKIDNAKWAYLQGNVPGSDIGYYFPNGSNINILRDHREGNWADINTGKNDGDKIKENNYLTMYLDHGANPQNQGYSYVLLPDKNAKEVEAYSNNPQIEIVRNDEVAHGVRHKELNMEGANFWTDGTNTSGIITSTGKSSVMVKENKDNTLSIAVSDPTFEQKSITIEIDKPGSEIISKDDRISNVRLENGKIKFDVNTENSQGLSYNLAVKLGENTTKPEQPNMEAINKAPEIDGQDITLNVGDKWDPSLHKVNAKDKEDGDLTKKITINDKNIPLDKDENVAEKGQYNVNFAVEDSKGAKSNKTLNVVVNEKENSQQPNNDNNNSNNNAGSNNDNTNGSGESSDSNNSQGVGENTNPSTDNKVESSNPNNDLPKTGELFGIAGLFTAAIGAIGSGLYILKRKKK